MKYLLLLFPFALLADPVKLTVPRGAADLQAALAALDGCDKIVGDKVVRVPYDFGKDSLRIQLAVRANLVELKNALDNFEALRVGLMREVFGVDALSAEELAKQPESKRQAFIARVPALTEPIVLNLRKLLHDDIAVLAVAGVPNTVSAALETIFYPRQLAFSCYYRPVVVARARVA